MLSCILLSVKMFRHQKNTGVSEARVGFYLKKGKVSHCEVHADTKDLVLTVIIVHWDYNVSSVFLI